MFLQRLTLENVRSIEKLELPFLTEDGKVRKWTLLLGENGSGKSTVLRAISLLLAGSEALPELLKNPDEWIRLGHDEAVIHADMVTAKGQTRTAELRLRRGDKVKDVFTRNEKALDELDSAIEHSPRNYLTIGYGVSRRLSTTTQSPTASTGSSVLHHPRALSVATMFSPDAVLNPLEGWAMDLHYRRGQQGLRIVKKALTDLLPGVTFLGIDKERRQLLFKTPDGKIPLTLLSDGYQNVAAWCGDLLYRITEIFADYKSPFSARGLLLVDELDLHLHPIWKRQLVNYLTEKLPNFQIIATTHSALTVHQAGPEELYVLRRETPSSAPTLYQFPGEPRKMMLHQLLLSPLFNLPTVDSPHVETQKAEFRRLRATPMSKLAPTEKRRFKELKQDISELPEWSAETEQDKRRR
ncbi:MAG: AAA family ATPase, partial [Acidobacteria bacterium]|nr:AAA family ATPase [Acidobacteriota bacterium]